MRAFFFSIRVFATISMIVGSVLFTPLATQAAYYLPGETLNPACAPTDSGCGVSSIVGSGTTTQVPYYASSGGVLSATSTFKILSSGTAQATNLTVDTTLTIGSLSGFLKATAGAVATALVNLASDVTGTLLVSNGGTGSTTLSGILKGNGTSGVGTLVVGSGLTYDGTTLFSSAPATTSSNTWAGTQTFTNAPVFSTFSGLVGTNSGTTYQISTSSLSASITGNAATVTNGVYTTGAGTVFLAPNGSAASLTSFPTLNQNTTGTASNVTGTVAATNGGTGSTTLSGILKGNGTSGVGTVVIGTGLTWDGTTLAGTSDSNYWTSAGGNIYNNTGTNVGIGTTTPWRGLSLLGTVSVPQFALAYDQTRYAQFQTDASGDLSLSASGGNIRLSNENLFVCAGGACPSVSLSGVGNLTVESKITAGSIEQTCATGYIWVPGSAKHNTLPGFCVMKYEAKNDGVGNAVSTAIGVPYVSIDQPTSRDKCEAIGLGYHLISEPEWMTIAENVATTPINDMDDDAGLQLATGHSDSGPSSALAATSGSDPIISGCVLGVSQENASNAYVASSCEIRGDGSYGTDDNDKGFYGTEQAWSATGYSAGLANKSQLRTLVLSNGNVIWDFAGNVREWTDAYVNGTGEKPTPVAEAWQEWSSVTNYVTLNYARPKNPSWTSANGIGQYYAGTSVGQRAFFRGGFWNGGAFSGVFTLSLHGAPSDTDTRLGVRCSR